MKRTIWSSCILRTPFETQLRVCPKSGGQPYGEENVAYRYVCRTGCWANGPGLECGGPRVGLVDGADHAICLLPPCVGLMEGFVPSCVRVWVVLGFRTLDLVWFCWLVRFGHLCAARYSLPLTQPFFSPYQTLFITRATASKASCHHVDASDNKRRKRRGLATSGVRASNAKRNHPFFFLVLLLLVPKLGCATYPFVGRQDSPDPTIDLFPGVNLCVCLFLAVLSLHRSARPAPSLSRSHCPPLCRPGCWWLSTRGITVGSGSVWPAFQGPAASAARETIASSRTSCSMCLARAERQTTWS